MKYKILIVFAKFYEDLSKNLVFGAKEKQLLFLKI